MDPSTSHPHPEPPMQQADAAPTHYCVCTAWMRARPGPVSGQRWHLWDAATPLPGEGGILMGTARGLRNGHARDHIQRQGRGEALVVGRPHVSPQPLAEGDSASGQKALRSPWPRLPGSSAQSRLGRPVAQGVPSWGQAALHPDPAHPLSPAQGLRAAGEVTGDGGGTAPRSRVPWVLLARALQCWQEVRGAHSSRQWSQPQAARGQHSPA